MTSDPRPDKQSDEHVDATLDEILSDLTAAEKDLDLDLDLSIPDPGASYESGTGNPQGSSDASAEEAQPDLAAEEVAYEELVDDEESPAEAPVGIAGQVAQLEAQLQASQQEAAEQRDKWIRAMAELENVRRRMRKELETTINLANADLIRELVEVADNFQRALDASKEPEDGPAAALKRGVTLIEDQFLEILKRNGLTRIECQGQPFDPNLHEAVSQIETDEVASEHIVVVVQEGYLLNNVVLRPARVVVAA